MQAGRGEPVKALDASSPAGPLIVVYSPMWGPNPIAWPAERSAKLHPL
jgi:hypothetical protein